MAIERERKFLVSDDSWRREVTRSIEIVQGYLSVSRERIVRVRVVDGAEGRLTVKGVRVHDRRVEFEYPIPVADADAMLQTLCVRPLLEKRRHLLDKRSPGEWVVDEFRGGNGGLVLAEVEFEEEDRLELPRWLGAEVTRSDRYANSYLTEHPYTTWDE